MRIFAIIIRTILEYCYTSLENTTFNVPEKSDGHFLKPQLVRCMACKKL